MTDPLSQPLANLEAVLCEMREYVDGYSYDFERVKCWTDALETVRCDLKEAQAQLDTRNP